MTKLTVICAWCGKPLGEKDGRGAEGESHGICDDCLGYYFPHYYDKVKAILELDSMDDLYKGKSDERG